MPGQWGADSSEVVTPTGGIFDLVAEYQKQGPPLWGFARMALSGKVTVLHQFSGSEGVPAGGKGQRTLAYGADGDIYGIGYQQPTGISQLFIFRFTPAGQYSQLLTIPMSNAGMSHFPLIAASDGNLYGTFSRGGTVGTGLIYQASLTGQYKMVAGFPATAMSEPYSLNEGADGNLYGSTNFNQLFSYNLATQKLSLVYAMNAQGTQARCPCPLIEGMDGKLYGYSGIGGPAGVGDVFSLDLGLTPPSPVVSGLYPASGAVGSKVLLWGNYLLGTQSVTFNGVTATSFQVTSKESVLATVPTGATSGPITITTHNGSLTTTQSFTVQ